MIHNISQTYGAQAASKTTGVTQSTAQKITTSFSDMFDQVNQDQLTADKKINEMVAGTNKDIPGTMVSMEKAETSLKMLMAVRSKMISAYEEMMRMQI